MTEPPLLTETPEPPEPARPSVPASRAAYRRRLLAEVLGLGALLLVLLDCFRPGLLFLPTIMAGGDTPCHFPTLRWFHEHLLPQGRLHGWYPGAYLGHPLLLYYFPLPFLVMSALGLAFGLPVGFKLGAALGVLLLPPAAWLAFRLMGWRGPTPLLGATAAFVFLFCEENPIWGGTIASTLTGEIAYAWGTAIGLVALAVVWRASASGRSPIGPGAVLGLTALAHGYAVLWAGLSASFLLYRSRSPLRTLGWLARVAVFAFAAAAFFLVPLLADWGWTTPYNDAWITVSWKNLAPPLLMPLFGAALVGLVGPIAYPRHVPPLDPRALYFGHAALVAAALAMAGPALGIIDVRFVPFAHLALSLMGAAVIGQIVRGAVAPWTIALGLTLLGIAYAEGASRVVRPWIDWNFTGLEAKQLWPQFRRLADVLEHGDRAETPRVAVEYSAEHEKAGSIRMYETLPHFSGRDTLEGVYNQASLQTHFVYYLASVLGPVSPNPFRSREYGRFDTEAAIERLRLFAARDVVALSPQLIAALERHPAASDVAALPPYRVFRLDGVADGPASYVEPLAFQPVRRGLADWRDDAYRWFSHDPLPRAPIVFTDDPAVDASTVEDPWLAPPEVALPPAAVSDVRVDPERISFRAGTVGHPVLVKVSYHPRWRVRGARGPYLTSPALMLVVPTQEEVVLEYAGRTGADVVGLLLTLGAIGTAVAVAVRRRRGATEPAVDDGRPPTGRPWGAVIPATVVLALAAARLLPTHDGPEDELSRELEARATAAWNEERWADAASYARHALTGADETRRDELKMLSAQALVRAGRTRQAEPILVELGEKRRSPYRAQALYELAGVQERTGQPVAARRTRERLIELFPKTPWAEMAKTESGSGEDPR